MQYKITSFTSFTTAEGERLSYTYSKINEETGDIVDSNIRKTIVIPDSETEALDACKVIKQFLSDKYLAQ